MKHLTIFILFINFSICASFGQEDAIKSINCVVLIDEILADSFPESYITIYDKNGLTRNIDFVYEVGQMNLLVEDFNKLQALDKYSKVTVRMKHEYDTKKGYSKSNVYIKNLEAIDLRQRYIIFKIYSCKVKGKFKVFVETPRFPEIAPLQKKRKPLNCKSIDKLMDRLVDKGEIISNQPKR